MAIPSFKRGDTFTALAQREGVDITNTTIRSQIRFGAWSHELTVTVTDAANGEFTLSASADWTRLWPTGTARWDIEYTDNGNVHSTETIALTIVEDVTHDD